MQILHGDNTIQSRTRLNQVLDAARKQGHTIIRLEAKKLELPVLEQAIRSESLFGENKVVVIEELHSLPTSNRKKTLLDYLSQAIANPEATETILWEKRALTATMLKKFGAAQNQEFKLSKALFSWLDSLNGQRQQLKKQIELLHQAVDQDDEYLCFLMMIRLVRMLLQVTDGSDPKGPPFMITKLKKQAATFTLDQLLKLHQRLLEIDYRQKTSNSALQLTQELDLLLATL